MLGKWFKFGYEGGLDDPQALARFCRDHGEVDSNASSSDDEGQKHDGRRHLAAPDIMYESRPTPQHRLVGLSNNNRHSDITTGQLSENELVMLNHFQDGGARRGGDGRFDFLTRQRNGRRQRRKRQIVNGSSSSSSSSSEDDYLHYGDDHEDDGDDDDNYCCGQEVKTNNVFDAGDKAKHLRRRVLAAFPLRRARGRGGGACDEEGNSFLGNNNNSNNNNISRDTAASALHDVDDDDDVQTTMMLQRRAAELQDEIEEVKPKHSCSSLSSCLLASIPQEKKDNLAIITMSTWQTSTPSRMAHCVVKTSSNTALVFGGIVSVLKEVRDPSNRVPTLSQRRSLEEQLLIISEPEEITLERRTALKCDHPSAVVPENHQEVITQTRLHLHNNNNNINSSRNDNSDAAPCPRFGATLVSSFVDVGIADEGGIIDSKRNSSSVIFLFGGTDLIPHPRRRDSNNLNNNSNSNNNNNQSRNISSSTVVSDVIMNNSGASHLAANENNIFLFLGHEAVATPATNRQDSVPLFTNMLADFWVGSLSPNHSKQHLFWKRVTVLDAPSSNSVSSANVPQQQQQQERRTRFRPCCFSQAVWLRKYSENGGALECHELLQFGGFIDDHRSNHNNNINNNNNDSEFAEKVSNDVRLFTVTIPTSFLSSSYTCTSSPPSCSSSNERDEVVIIARSKSLLGDSSCVGTPPTARGGHSMVKIGEQQQTSATLSRFPSPLSLASSVHAQRQKTRGVSDEDQFGNNDYSAEMILVYGGYGYREGASSSTRENGEFDGDNKHREATRTTAAASTEGPENKTKKRHVTVRSLYAGLEEDDDDDDDEDDHDDKEEKENVRGDDAVVQNSNEKTHASFSYTGLDDGGDYEHKSDQNEGQEATTQPSTRLQQDAATVSSSSSREQKQVKHQQLREGARKLDYLNDCYLFDLRTCIWRRVDIASKDVHRSVKLPRCFQSMAVFEKEIRPSVPTSTDRRNNPTTGATTRNFEVLVVGGETRHCQPVGSCFRMEIETSSPALSFASSSSSFSSSPSSSFSSSIPKIQFHKQHLIGLDGNQLFRRRHRCQENSVSKRHGSMLSCVVLRPPVPSVIKSGPELFKVLDRRSSGVSSSPSCTNQNFTLNEQVHQTLGCESTIVILGGSRSVSASAAWNASSLANFPVISSSSSSAIPLSAQQADTQNSTNITCVKHVSNSLCQSAHEETCRVSGGRAVSEVQQVAAPPMLRLLAARWLAASDLMMRKKHS